MEKLWSSEDEMMKKKFEYIKPEAEEKKQRGRIPLELVYIAGAHVYKLLAMCIKVCHVYWWLVERLF